MGDIKWVRVGHDLFVEDLSEYDGKRHPTETELDDLLALWPIAARATELGAHHHLTLTADATIDPNGFKVNVLGTTWSGPPINDLTKRMQMDNLRMWLIQEALEFGTPHQRELWDKGLLPHGDVESLARDHLFRHIETVTEREGIQRWHPVKYSDVPHKGVCQGRVDFTSRVAYGVPDTLNQHLNDYLHPLDAIDQACKTTTLEHPWLKRSGASVTGTVMMHRAQCASCGKVTLYPSVKITIPWGDRAFTREYAL
jgi:hypothetical protein